MSGSLVRSVLFGACAVMVALAFVAIDPVSNPMIPACPTFTLFGIYCPGCGTIRAMDALLHGHVLHALSLNAAAVVFIAYLVVIGFDRAFTRWRWSEAMVGSLASRIWLWGLVLFWFLRNLPMEPFRALAPLG